MNIFMYCWHTLKIILKYFKGGGDAENKSRWQGRKCYAKQTFIKASRCDKINSRVKIKFKGLNIRGAKVDYFIWRKR